MEKDVLSDAYGEGRLKIHETVAPGKGACVCRKAAAGFENESDGERRRNKDERCPPLPPPPPGLQFEQECAVDSFVWLSEHYLFLEEACAFQSFEKFWSSAPSGLDCAECRLTL